MKDRILLEVHLPAAQTKYDIWVSEGLQVKVCTELMATTLEELSLGRFHSGGDVTLCDYATGEVFDGSVRVSDLGLQNGSRVLLI